MKKRTANRSDAAAETIRSDEASFAGWEANPQAQALRVDLQTGAVFVFPYSHFAFAHLKRTENREALRISFTTHDVNVCGHHLRELVIALQKLSVEWIREVPARYAALGEKDRAFIECIDVAETDDENSPPD